MIAADALTNELSVEIVVTTRILPCVGLSNSRDASLRARCEGERRRATRERCVLATCAAPSEEFHRVTVEFESVQRAQRFGELLDRGAIDVFDAAALAADRVMVVVRRLAEHVRRLALGVGALGDLALRAQMVERAIDGRERDFARRRARARDGFRRRRESAARAQGSTRSARAAAWRIRPGFPCAGAICERFAKSFGYVGSGAGVEAVAATGRRRPPPFLDMDLVAPVGRGLRPGRQRQPDALARASALSG